MESKGFHPLAPGIRPGKRPGEMPGKMPGKMIDNEVKEDKIFALTQISRAPGCTPKKGSRRV
ncbi:MAG: hypothetical protein CVU08_10245 [Bacteroidetes bacterium HGW-Bacteroidetes-3]|nr:MAG: hypothetical protein CVU08_10245 [Bacteroidetes bacterium HGW-Bacteroidetes-3]